MITKGDGNILMGFHAVSDDEWVSMFLWSSIKMFTFDIADYCLPWGLDIFVYLKSKALTKGVTAETKDVNYFQWTKIYVMILESEHICSKSLGNWELKSLQNSI